MFNLTQSPTYWWPVSLKLPAASGAVNEFDDHQLEVEFRRLDEEAFDQLLAEIEGGRPKDRQLAAQLVVGFRHGIGKAPKASYTSSEDLAALLRLPGAGSAVVGAFFESRVPAARKN